MIAARIASRNADDETLEEAIRRSAGEGLVPCVPKRFCFGLTFRVTFLHPQCIPASLRRMIVRTRPGQPEVAV
jgi:hypothetical protein